MSENAGVDPRVAAAEQAAYGEGGELDQTQVAEDPSGESQADREPEPDELH